MPKIVIYGTAPPEWVGQKRCDEQVVAHEEQTEKYKSREGRIDDRCLVVVFSYMTRNR